jgi:NAD(P)-dependent dehydrogenase (short-subunit alcohol dehydrogenase family)
MAKKNKTPLPGRPKQAINNVAHTPWGSLIVYHLWWLLVTVVKLPLSVLFLCLSLVSSIFSLMLGFGGSKSIMSRSQRGIVPPQKRREKVVVITGCDSGFGRAVALELALKHGFYVVAGCLRPGEFVVESQEEAANSTDSFDKKLSMITSLELDVTKQESVDAFAERVHEDILKSKTGDGTTERVLHAIINNAGVGSGGCVDWLDVDDFQRDMNVNFFGIIRVTKALLPLLKAAAFPFTNERRGRDRKISPRIINVTSMAGLMPVPFMAPYCASKHAAEALSACLRTELMAWGIKTSTINPSFHQTPLVANGESSMVRRFKRASSATQNDYGVDYLEALAGRCDELLNRNNWEPHNVVS